MIELIYFEKNNIHEAYQVIQFRAGESWRIVREGELLGSLIKKDGDWQISGQSELAPHLIQPIGGLIDAQEFNRLPGDIKYHWSAQIQDVIPSGDAEYLVITKPGIDFDTFLKLFSAYIPNLLKVEWPILFRLYNADMSADAQLTAQR
ncbi:hypothetical protein [Pedobacter psychroterrae]|uniref:Uncharacterized protein n=1 Tax=Pedobacter psychroterrae TaxID=2530453 RepID=A0A4R0NK96_9SPHI|nr:hypothetical protein [Pedobacter psychroterrae]TCC99902.1 hypothetical protein EZ437_16820 [Pedobacter psychroterrae]